MSQFYFKTELPHLIRKIFTPRHRRKLKIYQPLYCARDGRNCDRVMKVEALSSRLLLDMGAKGFFFACAKIYYLENQIVSIAEI